jgi:hypothetical protein
VSSYARNRAVKREIDRFGKIILLEYLDTPYNQFCVILKIADENIIFGTAFLARPKLGEEILTLSMSRKYPLEFMTLMTMEDLK